MADQIRVLVVDDIPETRDHLTKLLGFEGDSRAVWFEGNYQAYEADRKKRLGIEAERPHRIKYRKLTKS